MSYSFYKWLHLISLFSLIMVLTTLAYASREKEKIRQKRVWMIAHGLALLLTMISGFGMAAKLGIFHSIPAWMWLKISIWFVLGTMTALVTRIHKPSLGMILVLILASLGALIGVFKV